jgi:hypothetical protein
LATPVLARANSIKKGTNFQPDRQIPITDARMGCLSDPICIPAGGYRSSSQIAIETAAIIASAR